MAQVLVNSRQQIKDKTYLIEVRYKLQSSGSISGMIRAFYLNFLNVIEAFKHFLVFWCLICFVLV